MIVTRSESGIAAIASAACPLRGRLTIAANQRVLALCASSFASSMAPPMSSDFRFLSSNVQPLMPATSPLSVFPCRARRSQSRPRDFRYSTTRVSKAVPFCLLGFDKPARSVTVARVKTTNVVADVRPNELVVVRFLVGSWRASRANRAAVNEGQDERFAPARANCETVFTALNQPLTS